MPIFLVLLNWHGGNSILSSLTTEITAREKLPTTVISSIVLAGHVWEEENEPLFDDVHAGALETSIIQAYWPELVAQADLENLDFVPNIEPAYPQSVFQALGMYAVSKTGVWGKPQKANPQKGRVVIEGVVKEIYSQIISLLGLIETLS
ncbi:hypothetical protein KDI_08870 [Dictyobacter arantiisoli]|uniref:Uncharacterized protein n=2 Tax=Dictyobacter arantiisoli TaxID=2014874 RepID=A0A5A5T8F7_9CHLR|nr:hypothetical protein KDI_08870 [Dictyobacter arantiisoli]